MKFYEVTAKCGHVGRRQFYMGLFYVRAENGREAATLVRQKPRVKHNHKDAILSISSISYSEYLTGKAAYKTNPYFNCKSKQEQRIYADEISADIHIETSFGKHEIRDDADRKSKLKVMRRLLRKMDKYGFKDYYIGA